MLPSGRHDMVPIRPPARYTRASSAAACSWLGANITPKLDVTTSKLSSSYGSSSASAKPKLIGKDSSAASFFAVSTNTGEKSDAVTTAPARAARTATAPVPVATAPGGPSVQISSALVLSSVWASQRTGIVV